MAQTPRALIGAASEGEPRLDWERQSLRRLFFVAVVAAAVVLVAIPLFLFRQPNLGVRAGFERPFWLAPVGFVVSVVLAFVTRSERISAQRRLDFGLVCLVIMCALAGLFRHSLPYAPEDVVRGASPVALCVLFFAVIVPVPPWRMGVAALAAAIVDPLTLWWTIHRGNPAPPWNLWLWLFSPNVIVAGLAVVVAGTLHRLGRAVERAQRMGAYRLVEKLGQGGMGEVWRAEHRTLARPAAVKLVRPEVLGARDSQAAGTMLRRFEREAQATAMLSSPHTIEVYDFGIADDGTFYYVMELLDGMDLESLARESGTLPPDRVCFLLEQMLHSLRDAHEAGVVHRDIKPANIFVCHRGIEYDFVKVLDFGLVKKVDADEGDETLTLQGSIAGTPAYMAPEAARGQEVDGRADLYAIGCVAYRLLSGRDVHRGDNVMQILYQVLSEEPPPLGEVASQPIPEELERIVMRCLAKEPLHRWPNAEVLAAAIRNTGIGAQWNPGKARAWWEGVRETQLSDHPDTTIRSAAPSMPDELSSAETLPAERAAVLPESDA